MHAYFRFATGTCPLCRELIRESVMMRNDILRELAGEAGFNESQRFDGNQRFDGLERTADFEHLTMIGNWEKYVIIY